MLIEADKREANFDERSLVPVLLADRQQWWFPKPWLEVRPTFANGKATSAHCVPTHGRELDALVAAVGEADNLPDQVVAVASLAAHLLAFNYTLEDHELDQLLAFRIGDDSSRDWLHEVVRIATGQSGPKAWSAGGG
jgi:hypothetical protein